MPWSGGVCPQSRGCHPVCRSDPQASCSDLCGGNRNAGHSRSSAHGSGWTCGQQVVHRRPRRPRHAGEHCPPTTAVGSRRRRRPQRGGHSTRQQCPGTAAWPATGQGARQGPVRSAATRSTAPASTRGALRAGPDLRGPCKLESTSATLLPRFCDSNVITCLPWTRKHECRLEKISDNYASRHRLCSP